MSNREEIQCREILCKAVVGKGSKFSQVTHTVTPPHHPSSILGAWIINHQYEAEKSGDSIEIVGTYDVNIWYSFNNNSKTEVAKETISYVAQVPLSYLDPKHRASTQEVFAECLQDPTCVEANVSASGTSVILKVEREFKVEMIAETKVCVVVCPGGCDDDDKFLEFALDQVDDDFEDLDADLFDDDLVD